MNLYRPFTLSPDEREELAREAEWQALREECFEEFEAWRAADWRGREDEDFGNWLSNKASWNRPNKYERAMDWNERGLA
jgi:hypothetical protein